MNCCTFYDFFSYIFNMDGIYYEINQNELCKEIVKDMSNNTV